MNILEYNPLMSHLTSNREVVIEVKGVYKSFKNVHAVRGIDLSLKKGQFLALLGPNGAGKTTLVEMIEGIQKPDKGEVLITGKKWHGNEDELHKIIGLSLQETYFIDKLRVHETLKLFASFYQLKNKRVDEVIEMVGLIEKRKSFVVNLSGGQRQRLALGIALLNFPRIILLDEPTTGLDPNARREIWSILLKLKAESQTSMILTTHYMEEAEQLCDQIIIMNQGEILKQGTLSQLVNDSSGEKIIEFSMDKLSVLPDSLFLDSTFSIVWDKCSLKGTLKINDLEKDLPDFFSYLKARSLQVKSFECRRTTLDDLFITLTGRHLHE